LAYSMTAFARTDAQTPIGGITLEIRSVNNRFLDLNFRLSELVRGLEPQFREYITYRVKRGRVDMSVRVDAAAATETNQLNSDTVKTLAALQSSVQSQFPDCRGLSVAEVLNWPGVVEGADPEQAAEIVMPLLKQAVKSFLENRQREGDKLTELIADRINTCATLVESLKTKMPEVNAHTRERLENRLAEFREKLDDDRLEQEVAILLNKSDVDEEIDRLEIHFAEVLRVIKQKEPLGRRLDFLMQELNREANTLGSKAAHQAVTDTSLELKVLIEQMREQVQNLE
jgi:uncharacterized protein (TIGR00255 family)